MNDAKLRCRYLDLDSFRGLLITLMVLDHVRSMFWPTTDPTALAATDSLLFMTRWITHLCAPGFFLLSGMSLRIKKDKGESLKKIAFSLLSRGVLLILLEVIFYSRMWTQAPGPIVLQVMWAFGVSMILAILFLKNPRQINLAIGIVLSLTGLPYLSNLFSNGLWQVFFGDPFFVQNIMGLDVYFLYAVAPWLGMMLVGFGLPKYPWSNKWIAIAGFIMLGLFITQSLFASPGNWMDVMRVAKYPPEPRFMLATLGLSAFIFLGLRQFPIRWLSTMGREPLTLYTVHLALIFVVGGFLELHQVQHIYAVWIGMVIVLVPVAWATTKLKYLWRRHRGM